ncbi:MAG: 3-methyl-2-oxobutanoate hydroxymethyltransferase [Candidatus Latescibacteria bacterium]|nr:3-methyl-2-oxobutanoate hydroxymethyltransferase [Candidatus Latescibacterota bacterium]
MKRERVTISKLVEMKKRGERIVALTAYEALIASILDEIGVDLILVGDSLGQVFAGYDTTLPVTMDQMIYHTRIVSSQVKKALVVGDMPFLSYQVDDASALRNAGRFLQEGGARAVKIEGGRQVVTTVQRIVEIGIPVLGHIGLTPQAIHRLGGLRIQARTDEGADRLMEDARMLEDTGVFGIVLEAIPYEVAARVTESLTVPTIGIGAGPSCDGQVLITQDMLGLYERLRPRYVRRYAELGVAVREACQHYMKDVREGGFPSLEESYS